jgi:hypothetical protein
MTCPYAIRNLEVKTNVRPTATQPNSASPMTLDHPAPPFRAISARSAGVAWCLALLISQVLVLPGCGRGKHVTQDAPAEPCEATVDPAVATGEPAQPQTGPDMGTMTPVEPTAPIATTPISTAPIATTPNAASPVSPTPAPTPKPAGNTRAGLAERARQLWDAKVAEDWSTVFLFEPTRGDEGVTEAEFIRYSETEEPFRVHGYTILQVLTEGDMGWVELDVSTSMRRFPTVPPVDAQRWDKWHRINGEWQPVPAKTASAYPAAPVLRDAEAEAQLRQRFDASWDARHRRDWEAMYQFIDPRDRDDLGQDVLAETYEVLQFLSATVHWVEVIDDVGAVYVTVNHKLNDPSMSKLPPRDANIREEWVRYQNEWYMDVKRAD